ncbi:MAG: hypothetical protein VCD00_03780 [Candidatus Hydrogenedentota bacterium]
MDILERYHLALSYLEKSELELANWLRVRDTNRVDLTHFDLVKDRYERHVKQARELTDTIHTSQRESIPLLEEEVYTLSRAQRKIIEAVSEGTMAPKEANKQNRSIADKLHGFEESLERARSIVAAKTSADLGSTIELPFEDFIEQLDLDDEILPIETRKKTESISPRNVLILVTLGAMCWWAWLYYQTLGHASWDTSVADNKQDIVIRCENTGKRSIRVHIPWGDGVPETGLVKKLHPTTFGILVYVKEKGKKDFQLLPDTPDLWKKAGNEHSSGESIGLRPGDSTLIIFDTLRLRKSGLTIDAVRLEYTRYGGRAVDRFQTTLP